ncbi:MAG: M23 family metallopeptidase, partial [Anaerolineales bacterium]|nr:M23 family metallopeptidase [Anaerolineales bacterium]
KVYVGQQVTQGALIGYSGNTGRSSGPHINFEIRLGGFERVNPLWAGYLP